MNRTKERKKNEGLCIARSQQLTETATATQQETISNYLKWLAKIRAESLCCTQDQSDIVISGCSCGCCLIKAHFYLAYDVIVAASARVYLTLCVFC